MTRKRIVGMVLAAVWGAGSTWIFWWFFVSVCCGLLFSASEPAIKVLLRNGWTTEQIAPYVHGLTTVLPALFYGFIFGLPLGLLAKHSLIVTWLIFVVAFLIALSVRMLLAAYNIPGVIENLASAIYLLTFAATLLFAFIANWARSAYGNHAAA